ncbi:hypothetical protein ABZT43_12385 [Streptomyces sp. NPDC005349]|uniref:hypothetical protein n=1 Tax=Streptomyces sp. NPDC005349 TaxID=3157037 RepID=UPI0033A68DD9
MQQPDDHAIQTLSNEGAQCGNCGDEPGDRNCPDCETCRRRYVTALRAAGWAPSVPADADLRNRIARTIYSSDWPNGRWDRRPAEDHGRYLSTADAVLAALPAPADRVAELEAKVADYENRILWHTTCGSCARVLDSSVQERERAERAEAEVEQLRAELRAARKVEQSDIARLTHLEGENARLRATAEPALSLDGALRIVADWHQHANEYGCTDADALAVSLARAGYALPDGEAAS